MNKNFRIKLVSMFLTVLLFVAIINTPAHAASVGFSNANITITSPSINNQGYDKSVTIEGTSRIQKVWLCLKGPDGEITTYPVDVNNGSFKKTVWLRFGSGKYTIWAGENGKKFDGKIRFEVQNTSSENYFSLTPSGYVNSDNPTIQNITQKIIKEGMTDLAKAKAIHDWVATNITYDTTAYYAGTPGMNSAIEIIKSKIGTCRDYSFTFASIARAAGLQTKVVYGDAWNNTSKAYEKHAWNETLIDGKWISVDTTWDAGYIKNKKFVTAVTAKYFNMDAETFYKTHKITSTTLY